MDKETRRRINHVLFAGIVSYFTRGSDAGELEIKIRGDGNVKKIWQDLKMSTGSFAHLGGVAPRAGLEPATHRLTADCSAN